MTKNAGAEDRTNIFLEEGKQSQKVNASQDANESEATVSVTVHEEKKNIIKTWIGTLVMIPLTIIINVFASTGNCYFAPGCFPHRSFFVAVAVNFYSSVAGLILWNTFRRVATGFLLMAFLSALVSVTILFGETLQGELSGFPWMLMIILILMVFYAGISSIVQK